MILTLDTDHERRYASWNVTLHRMLAESRRFEVRYAPTPRMRNGNAAPPIAGRVSGNLSTFLLDDKLIVLDTWDTDSPTTNAWRAGMFAPGGVFADAALVVKIQHDPKPLWDQFTAETGKPITAWTIFPSREFLLGSFRWRANAPHVWTGTLTGAMRFGRGDFIAMAKEALCYTKDAGKKDPLADYMALLEKCQWGISLRGKRGHDGKNRREVEFASCGMPLALNYQPHYPFPFQAGTHYVFLREPRDLSRLQTIDPRPFAERSVKLWEQRFSPVGMADTLVDLLAQYQGKQNGLARIGQAAPPAIKQEPGVAC